MGRYNENVSTIHFKIIYAVTFYRVAACLKNRGTGFAAYEAEIMLLAYRNSHVNSAILIFFYHVHTQLLRVL